MAGRRFKVLEYVIEHGRVTVDEIVGFFAVPDVTISKDLDRLERGGLIRREHGFAIAIAPDNMRSHLAFHYDAKRRIARAGAATVPDGGTVMIESGSCCALLANEIVNSRRGVTLITNSAFIAGYVRTGPSAKIVLLGGDYQTDSQVLVGPLTAQSASGFYVDQLFIGIDGYTPDEGFTARDHMRAEAVRAMARQAREVIVLSESLKFPRRGAVHLLPATLVSRLFTDDRLSLEVQTQLTSAGVTITKAVTDPESLAHAGKESA
jgi:DeoR/GlpR family transcriptional regulator of sugar metabolism